MSHKLVRVAALCLLAAMALPAWAGNVCSESRLVFSGIGGTGSPFTLIKGNAASSAAEAGMGGTGMPQRGGIGGTGAVAEGGIGGTGIVGVVTGFGSICVDGLEVHYSNGTPVDIDGNMSNASKLLLGQVVAVSARGEENNLQASSISVVHALAGPIASLDITRGLADVAGIKVRAGYSKLAAFKPGDTVKVSGLWMSDGSLAALRIDPAPAEAAATAAVMGPLQRLPNGRLSVAGVEIMPGERSSALPAEGNDVRVSGVWEGKHLRVLAVWDSPVDRVLRHNSEFYLQGFAVQAGPDGQLRIGAQPMEVRGPGQLGSGNEQLAVAHGRVDAQGKLIVQDVTYHGGPAHQDVGPGPTPGSMDGRPGATPGNPGSGAAHGRSESGGAPAGGSTDAPGSDRGVSMPNGGAGSGGPGPAGGPAGVGGGRR